MKKQANRHDHLTIKLVAAERLLGRLQREAREYRAYTKASNKALERDVSSAREELALIKQDLSAFDKMWRKQRADFIGSLVSLKNELESICMSDKQLAALRINEELIVGFTQFGERLRGVLDKTNVIIPRRSPTKP